MWQEGAITEETTNIVGQRGHESPQDVLGSYPRRTLLKDRAYEKLKNLILNETFPPRTFLSERMLSKRLEMSKTPIRAALERLEAEEFVDIAPQQGIVVRELSLDEVVNLFDIRRALETFVVRQLAGALNAEQIRQLEANLEAQRSCAEKDLASYSRLDAEFHLSLCRIQGNREIEKVMLRLQDKVFRVVARVSRTPGRSITSYEEHVGILDAIVRGEGELAATRVDEHLLYGKRFLLGPG